MAEKNKNDGFSRRSVLRKTAASAATVTLASAANTASAEQGTPDFEVVNQTELSDDRVQTEFGHLLESSAVQNLDRAIQAESDVEVAGRFGIQFETDDPEINKTDPVILFGGYRPDQPGREAAGMLVSIVVDTTPDEETSTREPMMAFGRTIDSPNEKRVSVSSHSAGDFELKTITADEQGTASVVQREPVRNPVADGSSDADGGVTTQDWRDALGCGACTAIVGTLCDGATGSVSRYACLEACAPFLGSVWGYGACGGACFVIVDAINNYGCAVGAGTICAGIDVC
ncbi:halocin C8-like domain-containing protein [Natrinema halophilum]|uniref:Halocin C8 n=1 Tax=Natrinema halophilum TaxID=1699371 RepID=A0A7D5KJY3_9EURY|nr:halocin C8-like domain-containing protein [Natrinema halophilum]QLG49859.1 hypothetical protein HYG82_13830 [Natrinema halophilum]